VELIFFSNLCFAFEPNLSAFLETGNRDTIEAIEGKNTLAYGFAKYYIKYSHPIRKPLNLTFVYNSYLKKYEDKKELDNNTVSVKTYWDYPVFDRKNSGLKFDMDFGWREKRYREKDIYTNSQWMLKLGSTYRIKDLWSFSGEMGYKGYDYFLTEGKDRKELSEKVEGKRNFYTGKLRFLLLLNFRQTDFDSRPDTSQFIYRFGMEVKPELSFLSEMAGRIEEGRKYTDEDTEEEQEGDYYFQYRSWWLKTEHPVFERISTVLRYTNYSKDYASADYDYQWFEVENRWKYLLLENPVRRLSLVFGYLHRETDYSPVRTSSYDKDSVEREVQFSRGNDWKAALRVDLGIYDYTVGRERDKNTYSTAIEIEKEIIAGKIALGMEYKRKLMDYELKPAVTQDAGRISIDYKF